MSEIKDIIEGTPGHFAFMRLRALIDTCPAIQEDKTLLQQIEHALRSWPPVDRSVYINPARMAAILRSPSWHMTRKVLLDFDAGVEGASQIDTFASDRVTRRLRSISVSLGDDDSLGRFHPRRDFPRLTSLAITLSSANSEGAIRAFLRDELPDGLRFLNLNILDSSLEIGIIDELLDNRRVSALRGLLLPGLSPAGLRHFLLRCHTPLELIGGQRFTTDSLELLCDNHSLASGLRCLNLTGSDLGDDAMALLANCPALGALERLNLRSVGITAAGVGALKNARFLRNLRRLSLAGNPLRNDGWSRIAALPLRRLRHLNLDFSGAGPDGVSSLARSRHLVRLRSLHMSGNPIGDEGTYFLARSALAKQLIRLGLNKTGKGPASAELLALHPLRRLVWLEFGADTLGSDGGEWLSRWTEYSSLKLLLLDWSRLGDDGLEVIASSGVFPALQRLFLVSNGITSAGVLALARSQWAASLRELGLYLNPIGDEGAAALASSEALSGLILLDLFDCDITGVGFRKLALSPLASRLDRIRVDLVEEAISPWQQSPLAREILRCDPVCLMDG